MLSITALLTIYNRRESTISCLHSLANQQGAGHQFALRVIVLDDGSTDGSSNAIRREFASDFVEVIKGPGDLFWARGMALAHSAAIATGPDAIIWVNDDVKLDADAVARAVAAMGATDHQAIVVGATKQASGDSITYTGARLRSSRPGSLAPVFPTDELLPVDAFNGNFVAIPRNVYHALGPVDARYEHAYGDIDYGLRARAEGISSYLLPGTVGICERNGPEGTWRDARLRRHERVASLVGRKGYPPRSHWLFNRNHGGAMAPLYFSATYARALSSILLGKEVA